MTEPGVGSDTAAITTSGRPVDGHYRVLTGQKTWISNGGSPTLRVFATLDPAPASQGRDRLPADKGAKA